jgi:hypothetical protein
LGILVKKQTKLKSAIIITLLPASMASKGHLNAQQQHAFE